MRYYLLLGLLTAAFPAQAQEIVVKTECDILPAHVIAAGNGAEYVPGVDVNGNAVVPADLNENINKINYPIEIPIEIDVLKMLNENPDFDDSGVAKFLKLDPEVSHITLHEDGRSEYNGQDITDNIHYKCGDEIIEMHEAPAPPPEPIPEPVVDSPKEPDRQALPDPVVSDDEKLEGQSP